MSATDHEDLSGKVAPLRADVERLSAAISALIDETHYEDLEHALLGLRIVDHALEETAEHAGLGGHMHRSPDPALHATASELKSRLEALAGDASAFLSAHPNEDLETAVTALEIAGGSLEEVVERYEEEHG
jgi:hypothetical protein